MLRTDQILSTIQMLQAENLDLRTVTMGHQHRGLRRAGHQPGLPKDSREDPLQGVQVGRNVRPGRPQVRRACDQQAAGDLPRVGRAGRPRSPGGLADRLRSGWRGGGTGHRPGRRLYGTGAKGLDFGGCDADGSPAGRVEPHQAGLCIRERGDHAGRHQHGRRPRPGRAVAANRRGDGGAERFRLRQTGDFCQHSRRQPLHGRGLPGRRRAGGGHQCGRERPGGWFLRPCGAGSRRARRN